MKISLEATEEARSIYGGGRKRKVCDARLGSLLVTADTKPKAAEALRLSLIACTLAPPPMARLLKDGRMAVAYLDTGTSEAGGLGWTCQLFHPDGHTSGSMGSDLEGCTVLSSADDVARAIRRGLNRYADGIDGVS
jgi:hypothetical protein